MKLTTLSLTAAVPAAALGVLEVLHDQREVFTSSLDYVVEVVFAISMLAATAAYSYLASGSTGLPRVAWSLCAAGSASVAVAATATAVAGEEVLGTVLGVGLLALVIGLLVALVADLRGRVEPRRTGVLLFVALVGSVVVEATGAGGLVLAAGWFGVSRIAETRQPIGV